MLCFSCEHVRLYLQFGILCFCKWAWLQATGYDLGTLPCMTGLYLDGCRLQVMLTSFD